MKSLTIDNSIDAELKRVILWQYDSAVNLLQLIKILHAAYDVSTKDFWDCFPAKINIANSGSVTSYALAVWGTLLGCGRPTVEIAETRKSISDELYRRILLARFQLLMSDASIDAYNKFAREVFYIEGQDASKTYLAKVVDGNDMSLDFVWAGNESPDDTEQQAMKYLIENKLDSILVFPAGVRSSAQNNGPVFGFDEQVVKSEEGEQIVGSGVMVRFVGEAETELPSPLTFIVDEVTWKSSCSATIKQDDELGYAYADVLFSTTVPAYLKPYVVTQNIISGWEDSVKAKVTCVMNLRRSATDFMIANFSKQAGGGFAWDRII